MRHAHARSAIYSASLQPSVILCIRVRVPRTRNLTTQLISLLSDVYRMSEEEEEALEGPVEETEEEVSEGKG